MGYIYALRVSQDGGEQSIIPILPDNEPLAKELANRYAAASKSAGGLRYDVIRSDIDWEPYEGDD